MVDTSSDTFIAGMVFCIVCVVPLYTAYVLHQYRDKYNMKAIGKYSPQALNFTLWAMCLWCALHALVLQSEITCASAVGFAIIVQIGMTLYCIRFTVLVFRFRIAEKLALLTSSQAPPTLDALLTGPGSWFIRHRRLISRPYLVRAFVGFALSVIGAAALVLLVQGVTCAQRRRLVTLLAALVVVWWIGFICVLIRFLKKTDQDAFGIRKELGFVAGIAFICLILVIPLELALGERVVVETNSIMCISVMCSWTRSVYMPLREAMKEVKQEHDSPFKGIRDVATLSDLLAIDFGYESFLSYSKREFAQENVLFWRAYMQFKRKYDDSAKVLLGRNDCLKDARFLLEQYVADRAPFQLNIPAEVREELIRAFHEQEMASLPKLHSSSGGSGGKSPVSGGAVPLLSLDATAADSPSPSPSSGSDSEAVAFTHALDIVVLFKPAYDEVYNLMVTDVLPRYIDSEEFVVFVQHMKQLAEASHQHDKDHNDHNDQNKDGSAHSAHSAHTGPAGQTGNTGHTAAATAHGGSPTGSPGHSHHLGKVEEEDEDGSRSHAEVQLHAATPANSANSATTIATTIAATTTDHTAHTAAAVPLRADSHSHGGGGGGGGAAAATSSAPGSPESSTIGHSSLNARSVPLHDSNHSSSASPSPSLTGKDGPLNNHAGMGMRLNLSLGVKAEQHLVALNAIVIDPTSHTLKEKPPAHPDAGL